MSLSQSSSVPDPAIPPLTLPPPLKTSRPASTTCSGTLHSCDRYARNPRIVEESVYCARLRHHDACAMNDATHVFTTLIVASEQSAVESTGERPPRPIDPPHPVQSHVAVATLDSACIHATGPNPPTRESCESTPTPTQYSSHDINGERKPTATQLSSGNSSDGSVSSSLPARVLEPRDVTDAGECVPVSSDPSRDRSGDPSVPETNPYPSRVAHLVTASAASLLNPISVARTHAQSVTSPTNG